MKLIFSIDLRNQIFPLNSEIYSPQNISALRYTLSVSKTIVAILGKIWGIMNEIWGIMCKIWGIMCMIWGITGRFVGKSEYSGTSLMQTPLGSTQSVPNRRVV